MNMYYIQELKTSHVHMEGREIKLYDTYEQAKQDSMMLQEHYRSKNEDGKTGLLFTVRRT